MGASSALGLRDLIAGIPRPQPGRIGDPGLFGPGSMAWRVNGETATILGGGRALLLQLANPMVAAGVADHSRFDEDPFARLWRTLGVVLTVIFGDSAQAEAAAVGVDRVHATVRGERGARPYRATDPELLLWVHATLVDSALWCYRRFVGPLAKTEMDRYLREMSRAAELFGVPAGATPTDLASFQAYLAGTIPELAVSAEARRLGEEVLGPSVAPSLVPARALFRAVTVGSLPAGVREGFGFRLGPGERFSLRGLAATLPRTLSVLPSNVRRWPHALAAEARVRGS